MHTPLAIAIPSPSTTSSDYNARSDLSGVVQQNKKVNIEQEAEEEKEVFFTFLGEILSSKPH